MSTATAWKYGDAQAPAFPTEYEIARKAVLQVTDIKTNRNKYYAVELHTASRNGASVYRVFTHYGRTDDLERSADAGHRECRYFGNAAEAEGCYRSLYAAKTSGAKGYREVSLASSRIGSPRARGTSAGQVDADTLARIASVKTAANDVKPAASTLSPAIQSLVRYLYAEATDALTSTVAAKITAHGIETPLGVLTLGQIEKGEAILHSLYQLFSAGKVSRARLVELSGDFYSFVPYRIGRTRAAIESAVIDSMAAFEQKQETLQLMKDMLTVDGAGGGVLFRDDVDLRYTALGCDVRGLEMGSEEFLRVAKYVVDSQVRSRGVSVKRVFAVHRGAESAAYDATPGNEQLLFHGSRIRNWVGILSRGIVMPKIAVSLGVHRTDAGWLGNGIYFGNAACTSAGYTSAGREGTRFMAIARVALGRTRDYRKITYGIAAPPEGFHSCHGVRARAGVASDFADDEFVVYDTRQQRLEYLVEFTA